MPGARRLETLQHRRVMQVGAHHRGILVAGQILDQPVLVGLKAGGSAERLAKPGVFARRHGAKHVPGGIELLENPGHPRQRLERRLQIVGRDQLAGGAELVDRKLHPQLGGLMLDDEQHLVMGGGERPLRAQNPVEPQIVRIGHHLAGPRLDVACRRIAGIFDHGMFTRVRSPDRNPARTPFRTTDIRRRG